MPSRKEWPEKMRAIADERIELSTRKNANYAGDGDAFFNFNLVEMLTHGKLTREQGIFVRMCDKMSRLGNLLFGVPDLVGESVEDTLKDMANYSDILLQAWREKHCQQPEGIEDRVPLSSVEDDVQDGPYPSKETLLQRFFARKAA